MLKSLKYVMSFLSALVLATTTVEGMAQTQAQAPETSLYGRLGGKAVVSSLVSDLIDQSIKNPRTRRSFDKVNVKRLKEKVEEQICTLTGGPCVYSGDDMKKSHAGLNITEAEFYGFVEELVELLDRYKIGLREKNQLLALLAPMKRDVVTR